MLHGEIDRWRGPIPNHVPGWSSCPVAYSLPRCVTKAMTSYIAYTTAMISIYPGTGVLSTCRPGNQFLHIEYASAAFRVGVDEQCLVHGCQWAAPSSNDAEIRLLLANLQRRIDCFRCIRPGGWVGKLRSSQVCCTVPFYL